ncbi:hypothetical protein Lal_00014298, partial [Lupinus albus]
TEDIGRALEREGIAVRSGHHCAADPAPLRGGKHGAPLARLLQQLRGHRRADRRPPPHPGRTGPARTAVNAPWAASSPQPASPPHPGPESRTPDRAAAGDRTEAALWARLRADAEDAAGRDPLLRSFIHIAVLSHEGFGSALGGHLARKLGDWYISAEGSPISPRPLCGGAGHRRGGGRRPRRHRRPRSGRRRLPDALPLFQGLPRPAMARVAIGCGGMGAQTSPISCKAGCRKPSPSTSIRGGSAAAC